MPLPIRGIAVRETVTLPVSIPQTYLRKELIVAHAPLSIGIGETVEFPDVTVSRVVGESEGVDVYTPPFRAARLVEETVGFKPTIGQTVEETLPASPGIMEVEESVIDGGVVTEETLNTILLAQRRVSLDTVIETKIEDTATEIQETLIARITSIEEWAGGKDKMDMLETLKSKNTRKIIKMLIMLLMSDSNT